MEYFPGVTTLQLVKEVQKFMNKMGDPSQFKGRIIFLSMFNGIIWGSEDNERECIDNATLVSVFAKRFPAGHWSFFGPGLEKKVVFHLQRKFTRRMGQSRRSIDDQIQRKRTHSFLSHESIVSRNAQKSGKLSIHTFGRSSCTRRCFAKVQRTSGKALTTKSCD